MMMKKYRLNRGTHQDKNGTYRPVDVIVTEDDLLRLNVQDIHATKKFTLLGEAAEGEAGTPSLGEPGNNNDCENRKLVEEESIHNRSGFRWRVYNRA